MWKLGTLISILCVDDAFFIIGRNHDYTADVDCLVVNYFLHKYFKADEEKNPSGCDEEVTKWIEAFLLLFSSLQPYAK